MQPDVLLVRIGARCGGLGLDVPLGAVWCALRRHRPRRPARAWLARDLGPQRGLDGARAARRPIIASFSLTTSGGSALAREAYACTLFLSMIDWQQLLQGELPAVHGVRIGDPTEAIPLDRVVTTEDEEAEEWQRAGGPSYIDTSCFVIMRGHVTRILMRGALLDDIPIREQGDIARLFGEPLGIERIFRWRFIYRYPQRQLSIAWNPVKNRVEQVAFGSVTWEPRMFSARDVLDEWLASDLSRAPDAGEPSDRSSSAWVRWTRVNALLRSFQLGSPTEFAKGEFLLGKAPGAYPRSRDAICTRDEEFSSLDYELQQFSLQQLFGWLLFYRSKAQQLLTINSGWLEIGFPGTLAAVTLTEDANRRIATEIADIDALLIELIDPDDRRIAERDLEGWIHDDDLKYLVHVETWGTE